MVVSVLLVSAVDAHTVDIDDGAPSGGEGILIDVAGEIDLS